MHPYENLLAASSAGIEPGINWYNPSATLSRYFFNLYEISDQWTGSGPWSPGSGFELLGRYEHAFLIKINNTLSVYKIDIINC